MSATAVSIIAVCVSIASLILGTFYNSKNSKHTDVAEIEKRASENTKLTIKLDEAIGALNDIKYDVGATRKDVQGLAITVAGLESSYKSLHKRIDRLERVLDLKREELDNEDSEKR